MALVTGAGRRRGIGAAICRALAHGGADVFFTYWRGYDRDVSRDLDEDGPEVLLEDLRHASAIDYTASRQPLREAARHAYEEPAPGN